MSSNAQPRGPLDGREIQAQSLRLSGLPSGRLINLRAPASAAAVDQAMHKLLGCARPTQPNTLATGQAGRILWLGPDEWLIELAHGSEVSESAIQSALMDTGATLCEVGAGLARVRIEGTQARWLLGAGSPLPSDSAAMAPGGCAQTRLAHASIIVVAESTDALTVLVRRSMAGYLWHWFEQAVARLEPPRPVAS